LTLNFSLWLLNWEFSDTILLLLRDKAIFAVSAKKGKSSFAPKLFSAKLLKDISGTPSGYEGPQLVIVEANIRSETPA
jgi:hypothetical protein